MSNKIKVGLVYTGIVLVWVGGFGIAAYAGSKIGEGVGRVCSEVTERMLKVL